MLHFFEENNISIHLSHLDIVHKSLTTNNHLVELYKHKSLGKILVIDGEIQHVEVWAPIYHEAIVHIPAAFIPNIKNVLILGGGSFYAALEVLKYSSVKNLIMVDHDYEIISLVKNNYVHVQQIIEDKRYTLIIEDAITFLRSTKLKFDLIINDAIDLLNVNISIFKVLTSCLSFNGICSDVIYRHIFESEKSNLSVKKLGKYHSVFSLIIIPEYPGVLHLLSIWSKTNNLNQAETKIKNKIQKQWLAEKVHPCVLYDPRFLSYYLHLPPYLKQQLSSLR